MSTDSTSRILLLLLLIAALLGLGALIAGQMPEIKRYMNIRSM